MPLNLEMVEERQWKLASSEFRKNVQMYTHFRILKHGKIYRHTTILIGFFSNVISESMCFVPNEEGEKPDWQAR